MFDTLYYIVSKSIITNRKHTLTIIIIIMVVTVIIKN